MHATALGLSTPTTERLPGGWLRCTRAPDHPPEEAANMDRRHHATDREAPARAGSLTRRALLQSAAITGIGAAAGGLLGRPTPRAQAAAPTASQETDWES